MHLESNEYGYGLYLKLENACFSYIAAALQYCYALWLLDSGKISSHDDYCCLDGKFFSQGSVSAFTWVQSVAIQEVKRPEKLDSWGQGKRGLPEI